MIVSFYTFLIILFCCMELNNIYCSEIIEPSQFLNYPPCKSCRMFIESFEKAMTNTSKSDLENNNLESYTWSKARLTEIQKQTCWNIEEGRDQCFSLNEDLKNIIEDWWFNRQKYLFKFICIESAKLCCPDFHYGSECTPCEGYPDKICNNNGKCKGAGTRKGNGKCNCDFGYGGEKCEVCDIGYYESYKDNTKLLCSKCHPSCDGACSKSGPTGCQKCANGWLMLEEKGCVDVNECAEFTSPCKLNQFCVNSEGSYQCLECDRSCSSCTGDGPDMCISCAEGFIFKDGMCSNLEEEHRNRHILITRYLTYFGLCVSTYIILQRNVMIAAVVGMAVGIYIPVSEYVLNAPSTPNATNLMHTLGF